MSKPYAPKQESDDGSPIIAIYQRIARVSDCMRRAAQTESWDDLVALGKLYLHTIQELREYPPLETFTAEERAVRTKLLMEIIDNDAAIRDITQPELSRLGMMLSQFGRQKSLIKAYGQGLDPRKSA